MNVDETKSGWPAILLASVAGFTDALGYLAFARVFTAHMSGNSAAVGALAGQSHWREVLERGMPIAAFLVGAGVGAVIVTLARQMRMRIQLAPGFILEIGLLTTFALVCPRGQPAAAPGTSHFFLLLWLLSIAMGIQAATLRRVGHEHVTTTFVSGMLISTVEEVVAWFFARVGANDATAIRHHARHAVLFAGIYSAFLAGAVVGSVCEVRWGPHALMIPIAGLCIVITNEFWRVTHPPRRSVQTDGRTA